MKPEYKQTDVGVIPEDWDIATGLEMTKLIGKGSSPRWQGFSYTDSGMLFVTSENVRDGFLDVTVPKYLPLDFHEKLKRTQLRKGDILVNLVGASIGRSCQVERDLGEANVNQAVAVFRVKEQHWAPFVAYYFQAPTTITRILDMQVDVARQNISLSDLRGFLLAVPPFPEQRAIAAALSDVDALIASLDKLIAKKRDIKQATMQQLLTGKKRLPGFSGEWAVKELEDIAEIKMGQSPKSSYYNTKGNGIPLIQGNSDVENRKTVARVFTSVITKKCNAGDLIMSVRAPVGQVAKAVFDACLGRGVCAISYPNDYMYHYLTSKESTWGELSKGSTFDSVNSADLKGLEIRLPIDKKEQTAIAAVLSDMDAELAALQARRDKTRDLKQGVMQELLTGRIRLV